jgi:hypothetical protein
MGPCAVLARPDDGGVDHRVFVIRIIGQGLEKILPNSARGQREKRLWIFFQSPKRSGKSRHGAPERNFQITASTNRRLPSLLLRPTVPGPRQKSLSPRKLVVRQIHSASSKGPLKQGSL